MIARAAIALGLAAALVAAYWGIYTTGSRAGAATVKQQWDRDNASRAIRTAEQTIQLHQVKDAAIKQAQARQQTLARDAAGNRAALVSLSDAAATALRDAQSTHATCIDRAAALADVFGRCTGSFAELAVKADQHASDAQTLIDAWPRTGSD